MEFISRYIDWIYIAGVVVAFIIFLFWNRNRTQKVRNRRHKRFGDGLREKKRQRDDQ